MRRALLFVFIVFLWIPFSFGQVGQSSGSGLPSVSDMLGAGNQTTDEMLDSAVDSMMEQMQTQEVTEETVQSAISGGFATEGAAPPEVNQEAAEAVDTKTQRYAPRIQLDFTEFPLRRISGRFAGVLRENDDVEEFEQSNKSLTNGIVKRIQTRLQIDTVRFEFKNRVATLSGNVATARQRDLIGFMVRLEPGIDFVKNDIVVDATP